MTRDYPTLNSYLKARREDTKGSHREFKQADVALAIGASQSLISKIERGLAVLSAWKPDRLYELLLAYRVPPARMLTLADEYHLPRLRQYVEERNSTYGVKEGMRVRHMGIVSAGKLGESAVSDEPNYVSVPDIITARYRVEDVFAVNVTGDSMVAQDARRDIPPGSLVYFHSRLRPEPGEIVCAYLTVHDQTVIKRWAPGHGYAVLASENPKHEPIVVIDEDEGMLQGVYLTHIPETPRLR